MCEATVRDGEALRRNLIEAGPMGSLLQAALAQSPAVEFHTEQGGAGSNPGAALFWGVAFGCSARFRDQFAH